MLIEYSIKNITLQITFLIFHKRLKQINHSSLYATIGNTSHLNSDYQSLKLDADVTPLDPSNCPPVRSPKRQTESFKGQPPTTPDPDAHLPSQAFLFVILNNYFEPDKV